MRQRAKINFNPSNPREIRQHTKANDLPDKMSENSFNPSDFARIQQFHQLFRMILRQHRTGDSTSFK